MSKLQKSIWLLLLYSFIAGCSATIEKHSESLIWQQNKAQLISKEQLFYKLPEVDILYLGEAHDNPEHHRLQLEILEYLQSQGKLAGLVMEMLNTDQQAKADQAYGQVKSEEELYEWLEWQKVKGWDWDFYGPMMWLAIKHNIPLKAGNITKKQMMGLYHSSTKPKAVGPYSREVREPLAERIQIAHCNKIDEKSLTAMVNIQQARDKKMAEQALSLKEGVTAVITGSYHARKDVGSPQFVQWIDTNKKVGSLIFVENSDEQQGTNSAWYQGVEQWGDWLWLTPKANTDRPSCG